MNRFAYRTTGLAIKTLSKLIQSKVRIHSQENIPSDNNSIIFVINHFTRAELMVAGGQRAFQRRAGFLS